MIITPKFNTILVFRYKSEILMKKLRLSKLSSQTNILPRYNLCFKKTSAYSWQYHYMPSMTKLLPYWYDKLLTNNKGVWLEFIIFGVIDLQ